MIQPTAIDQRSFRKLLGRNISLPLGVGLLSAVVFVAVISYLLSVIQWVEHTDRVINSANESIKLSIDMETGLRGFLIAGDEHFLEPYSVAKPRIDADLASLQALVSNNTQQVERVARIKSLQAEWNRFAENMINLRRSGGAYVEAMRAGHGKRLTDQIRQEYEAFVSTEQQLRQARSDQIGRAHV